MRMGVRERKSVDIVFSPILHIAIFHFRVHRLDAAGFAAYAGFV
jgi:hypothetical protein